MCSRYEGETPEAVILARFKKRGCVGYKMIQKRDGHTVGPYTGYKYKKNDVSRRALGFCVFVHKVDAQRDAASCNSGWEPHTHFVRRVKLTGNLKVRSFMQYITITGRRMRFIDWAKSDKH